MIRTRVALVLLIAVELAVGSSLLTRRPRSVPTPPVANLEALDPITAADIRDLTADCHTPEQWGHLGEVYLAHGFFPEAEACYRVASQLASQDADLAFKHAFALERIGRIFEANARYQAAIDGGHPRAGDAHYYIGRNHLRLARTEEAATAFARAQGVPAARYELALLEARAGRPAAVTEADRLMAAFPDAREPVALRYRLAVLSGDRATADRLADRFLSRRRGLPNPFDVEFEWVMKTEREFGWRGRFTRMSEGIKRGQATEAESECRVLAQAQWTPELTDQWSESLYLLGRKGEAVEVLEEAVERAGPSPHLLFRLGDAYVAANRPTDARRAYERAIRVGTGPDHKDAWARLSEDSERTGNKPQAQYELARGLILAGIGLLDAGQPREALGAFTEVTSREPKLATGWYFLGETYRALGRVADARSAYDKCLAADANYGRAARARRLIGD